MIGYLKGNIVHIDTDYIILDVQGVGYSIYVTEQHFTSATVGSEMSLYIYTSVSERDIQLFGFSDTNEMNFFKMLISVGGIGPKSAISILNTPYTEIANAIMTENELFLTQLPGIGRKTAGRMVVELKSKLHDQGFDVSAGSAQKVPADVAEALSELGYTRKEIAERLKDIDLSLPIEEIIKKALQ